MGEGKTAVAGTVAREREHCARMAAELAKAVRHVSAFKLRELEALLVDATNLASDGPNTYYAADYYDDAEGA